VTRRDAMRCADERAQAAQEWILRAQAAASDGKHGLAAFLCCEATQLLEEASAYRCRAEEGW
jgi:hypothetical protein